MPHINNEHWIELSNLFGDDMTGLITDFVTDSKVRINTLKDALESSDNDAGLNEAHILKGASANLGAETLSKNCAMMQEICNVKMIADAHNILADIETEFNNVVKEIQERLAML